MFIQSDMVAFLFVVGIWPVYFYSFTGRGFANSNFHTWVIGAKAGIGLSGCLGISPFVNFCY